MSLLLQFEIDEKELSQQEGFFSNNNEFSCLRFPDSTNKLLFFAQKKSTIPTTQFVCESFSNHNTKPDVEISKAEHAAVIESALKLFQTTLLKKVVVSRIRKKTCTKSILEWLNIYTSMCVAYPNALVYWLRIGNEVWMGATPELLLSKRGKEYKTVALAATKTYDPTQQIEHTTWGEKEGREQSIVTESILTSLQAIGAKPTQHIGPRTIQAGSLLHLITEISFEFEGSVHQVLSALHPTPAVCGFPLEYARQFIYNHEPHSRSLYTGYLGVLYANGDADYFVNLRCMRMRENEITLFAGGGIVEGSVAEMEWEETERKMSVMGKFL